MVDTELDGTVQVVGSHMQPRPSASEEGWTTSISASGGLTRHDRFDRGRDHERRNGRCEEVKLGPGDDRRACTVAALRDVER